MAAGTEGGDPAEGPAERPPWAAATSSPEQPCPPPSARRTLAARAGPLGPGGRRLKGTWLQKQRLLSLSEIPRNDKKRLFGIASRPT